MCFANKGIAVIWWGFGTEGGYIVYSRVPPRPTRGRDETMRAKESYTVRENTGFADAIESR